MENGDLTYETHGLYIFDTTSLAGRDQLFYICGGVIRMDPGFDRQAASTTS